MKKNEKKRSIIPNLWYGYIDLVFFKLKFGKNRFKGVKIESERRRKRSYVRNSFQG